MDDGRMELTDQMELRILIHGSVSPCKATMGGVVVKWKLSEASLQSTPVSTRSSSPLTENIFPQNCGNWWKETAFVQIFAPSPPLS